MSGRMTPDEYQRLARRTECDQLKALGRMIDHTGRDPRGPMLYNLIPIRLNHSALGLAGEVGELAGAVERFVYYGRPLDQANLVEEMGDCMWYLALLCNTIGVDMTEVMEANIRKLKARYPDKYTDERAAEEGRDRAAEREAMVQTGHGWAQPPDENAAPPDDVQDAARYFGQNPDK